MSTILNALPFRKLGMSIVFKPFNGHVDEDFWFYEFDDC